MTRVMVLGLLSTYGPMSGYEIQQKMQSAQTDKWAYVQPASIYHALKKLDKEQFVILDTLEQTGNRSKAIYSITDKGKTEFKRLLIKSFEKSSVIFPTDLYTALTFIENSDTTEILKALDIQKKAIEKTYEDMKKGQKEKSLIIEIPQNVMMIFNNIYTQCEMQLKFIEDIKRELEANT